MYVFYFKSHGNMAELRNTSEEGLSKVMKRASADLISGSGVVDFSGISGVPSSVGLVSRGEALSVGLISSS